MVILRRFATRALFVVTCLMLVIGCGRLPETAPGAIAATGLDAAYVPTTVVTEQPASPPSVTPEPSMPPEPSATPAPTATTIEPAALEPIDMLSDEWDDSTSLAQWQDHAEVEGWPSWIEQVDVNTTSEGHLYLVPTLSGWFEDRRGVFLFKEVTGDFDVRTRIRATGKEGDLPKYVYSLSGLMARAPRTDTGDAWVPRRENWVFITTGYGDVHSNLTGKPQIETKTTTNSKSNLWLIESRNDWVELRIVRSGPAMLMLYRFEGGEWTLSKRFVRKDLPPTLQVGINAYSSGGSGDPDDTTFNRNEQPGAGDLVVRSDYIRFRRPQLDETAKAQLAKGKLGIKELIAAIGE